MSRDVLIVLLNGPLGVGKSTLGEVLGEAIEGSVTLDGDWLTACNPPPADETSYLHETIALLVKHHLANGYSCFVINHYWSTPAQIADLAERLHAFTSNLLFHCFRLTLPVEENLRRIGIRRASRAVDEAEFEDQHFREEAALFARADGVELGVPFDASAPPDVLCHRLLAMLGISGANENGPLSTGS
ncbi:hypothetical protein DJ018_10830 [Phenylobacterium deserti]|uniref:Shikimate kinase n=2 Tax=Phenylobacterium deserti TaxID=1914756 RepID=A0A328AGW9_9CAUL|nr:hypothetical protein DJ018_10830 [Phenylobacterium deserti]